MHIASISFLQATVAEWPNRLAYEARESGRWQVLQLRRRQSFSAPHYMPAGLLIATEGLVQVQRTGLAGALPTGQALLLEECAAATQIHCGPHDTGFTRSISEFSA